MILIQMNKRMFFILLLQIKVLSPTGVVLEKNILIKHAVNREKILKNTANKWTLVLAYSIIDNIEVINNGKVD